MVISGKTLTRNSILSLSTLRSTRFQTTFYRHIGQYFRCLQGQAIVPVERYSKFALILCKYFYSAQYWCDYVFIGPTFPVKIGLCSETSNGIYFAFPLAHKASCKIIADYASDNLNTQPLATVTVKADRLSQLRQVGIRRQRYTARHGKTSTSHTIPSSRYRLGEKDRK